MGQSSIHLRNASPPRRANARSSCLPYFSVTTGHSIVLNTVSRRLKNRSATFLYSRQLASAGELDIPAGQITRHDGYAKMYLSGRLTGFQPHMHFLGTRQCLELIYPNATTEMVNCANFDFNWHIVYNYTDDTQPIYPAGTTLHVISYHDNTEGNRGASDPKNWTGGGSRTIDEMAFGWISWYDLSEEEYAAELEARRKASTDDN